MAPKLPRIPAHLIHPSKTVLLHTTSVHPSITQYPLTLKTQGPDESEPVNRVFKDKHCLAKWVSTYRCAALKAFATQTQDEDILSESQYFSLDTTRIYGISSSLHAEEKA